MKPIFLFFFLINLVLNAQNCEGFDVGIFELKGDFGTIIIERQDNWQLERSVEYNTSYLNKIEKISDCEYILHRYKVLEQGIIPKPDMLSTSTTLITNVKDNNFYFKSTMTGVDFVLIDKFVKISDVISDEFKIIIAKEER